MHFPKNNLSKGLNESKEKIDSLNFNKTHHFSPNITKKTVGINLNNFLSSKPNMLKDENELQNNDSMKNIKVNSTYNSNQLSGSVVSSNFQKYTKNNVTNIKSSVINNSNYSVVNTSTTNNLNITNSNNNMNSTNNAFPNKNIKLESIKNINNVIKKLKGTNVNPNPINIQQGSIKGKIDVNKQLIALKNKTQIIPAINSNQNSNLQSSSNINHEFSNVIHMSSNSMNNMNNINSNNGLKSDKINLRNSNNLYGSQIENMSLFQQGTPINNNVLEKDENSNNRNHSYNLYSNNSEKKSISLFKPENVDKNLDENELNIVKSYKKVSLQDTKDNSSNSSTIKFKHSNNTSISMGGLSNNSNIENPEDLHFFYVKMFQQNKELAFKFEKD